MDTQSETSSSISEEQSTKSSQDAMRTRVRLFAEGVVKMVSPVLLALALRKVHLKGEGTLFVFVQRSISPIAAVTMAFGILLMVLLWLCLSKIFARVEWLQDAASKLLVHICAILLMCLAYFILLLISMDYKVYIAIVLPLVGFITYRYICSLRGDDDGVGDGAGAQADYERELESSVDFFAAFTVLLFLGLERLALELHLNSNREGMLHPHDHLESTLAVSLITCVLGVVIMFIWTVPPSVRSDERSDDIRGYIEASNVVLALLITVIVLWITWAPLNANALWVFVPPLVSLLLGTYVHLEYPGPAGAAQEDRNGRINPVPGTGSHVVDIESHEQQQSDQPEDESQSHGPSLERDREPQGQIDKQSRNVQQSHDVQSTQDNSNLVDQPRDDRIKQDDQGEQEQPPEHDSNPPGEKHPDETTPESGVQHPPGEPSETENQPINTTPSLPPGDSEVKPPPPLELMKFGFAGFLAISIPSIRDCSLISGWTHAFILFTGISVVSALLWRLLSHRAETPRALVVAANFASFFAHAFAVAALVPFAVMADMNARLVVPDCRG